MTYHLLALYADNVRCHMMCLGYTSRVPPNTCSPLFNLGLVLDAVYGAIAGIPPRAMVFVGYILTDMYMHRTEALEAALERSVGGLGRVRDCRASILGYPCRS